MSRIRNYSICLAVTANAVRDNNCVTGSKTDFGIGTGSDPVEDQGTDTADTSYEYTLSGLDSSTAYFVGVAARNGVTRTQGSSFPGVSVYAVYQESSSDATVTPLAAAAPATPSSVTAMQAAGSLDVDLTWALDSDGGSAVTAWEIVVGIGVSASRRFDLATADVAFAAGVYSYTIPAALTGSTHGGGTEFTSLQAGTTYGFRITATNAVSDSAQSTSVTLALTAAAAPPGVPTGVGATGGDASIAVTWTPPTGTPTPDGFHVCVPFPDSIQTFTSFDDDCDIVYGTGVAVTGATTASVTLGGGSGHTSLNALTITNGVTYRVAVRSYVGSGASQTVSAWVASDPETVTPTPLGVPGAVAVDAPDARGYRIHWAAPDGAAPVGYEFCAVKASDVADTVAAACGTSVAITVTTTDTSVYLIWSDLTAAFNRDPVRAAVRARYADDGTANGAWAVLAETITPPSDAATLHSLTLTGITGGAGATTDGDQVAFAADTTAYAVTVAASTDTTTVLTLPLDAEATIALTAGGNTVTPDGDSFIVSLTENGDTVITITVTAYDGTTMQDYVVTVTREAAVAGAPDAPLSATAARGAETDTVDVTWVPATSGATAEGFEICVSHFPSSGVSSCSPGRIGTAAADATTFTAISSDFRSGNLRDNVPQLVAVRAFTGVGGAMKSDWTVATPNPLPAPGVTLSSDANLDELTLSGIDIGTFASDTLTYTASVANSVATTTVTAEAAHAAAAVRVTSDRDNSINDADGSAPGAASDVDLAEGANVITVTVTAQDARTTQDYVITVTREAGAVAPPPATLPTVSIAAAAPTVTEGTDAAVSFTVTSTPAPSADLPVTVTLSGGDAFVDAAARAQSATIAEGATTATVNFPITDNTADEPDATVTATIGDSDAYEGDGATATAMILDDDEPAEEAPTAFSFAAQSDLEPSAEVTSAAVTVAGLSASSVSVTVTTTAGTVSINGGAAATTGMASNGDTVTATVTSGACGTAVTATVNIGGGRADFVVTTRACNTDATLSALALTGVTLAPAFAPETLAYTADVGNDVATTTVTATATDAPRARVAGDGDVNLAGGTNNIVITVTAEDGSTREYTVTIARDRLPTASADATPNPVNPGGTVTLTGRGTDADGNNPATAYAWACAYDDAQLPLPACEVTGDTAATASYSAPTMEELDELEIAGAIAITFTLTVTFTNGETPSDQTTVTLRSQNREMVMAAGVVSLGAIDRSIAQQSTGLIAQRFNANIATPTGTGGGGGESSQLVNNLKRALTPNARDDVAQVAPSNAPEKLSHAPGSHEARYEGADNWQRVHTDDINLLNILEKNPVAFSLGDGDGSGGEFGVWFAATHSDISGAPVADGTRTAYDGRATTLQAGIDQTFNDGALLLGLALSWNTSDVDFTATNAANASRTLGTIERTGLTIHPYLSWRANPRTSLWLLGGFGDGDYTVTLTDAGLGGKSDASQLLLAGGVESTLTQSANFEALMRGGAFLSRSEVDASGDVLAFESDSWQVQGEVEAARVSTGEGRTLRQYLLGIARAQGGDDLSNGAAFGLGFGVKGNLSARGLSFDVGARVEAAETTDLDEERALWKTIYGALRYDAGDDGRGLTASLEQGMSQVLKSSWRTGAFDDADGVRELDMAPGMQATVGYGWGASLGGRAGVLTAFGEMVATEQALGLRFEAARFELRLEMRERELERRTQVRVEMDF